MNTSSEPPSATPEFHVLVAAAGQGKRLGGTTPKQYIEIHGKTLLHHTLENILHWPGLKSCHVIINPEHKDLYEKSVTGLDLPPFIAGGKERKNSINNGLKSIPNVKNDDLILIHDAARPFTKWGDVKNLLYALQSSPCGASLACPVSDTLRKAGQDAIAGDVIKRDKLWALQTPQGFRFKDLKKAHQDSDSLSATDDTVLVSKLGIPVKLVRGSCYNIKITTKEDMILAKALLSHQAQAETYTGLGFDVHRFETEKNTGRPLKLCGIALDYPYALAGHSDADVALHALTDAILGTLGAGDIGQHFPPSDPQFENMDSAVFLEKTMNMLLARQGRLVNIDLTLICEHPKIGPYRTQMIECISGITGLESARINIKATTTEKLGFTGRGEGIAAQALVTITLPKASP